MEQSQLIELILRLKPEEKAQISRFAAVEYFNSGRMRRQIIPLLNFCLSHPWEKSDQKVEKEQVYEIVFPNQPFIEGKLEKAMVEALKVVRSFLLTQKYFSEENEFFQALNFSQIIRHRDLRDRFQLLISKIEKKQEEAPIKSGDFFQRQFYLEYEKYDEASIRNQSKGDLNVPKTLHYLDLYYYHYRFELLNQYLLQSKVTNLAESPISPHFFEPVNIPSKYLEESPDLMIKIEISKMLQKERLDSLDVQNLFDLIKKHEKELDPKSMLGFYTYLRNACILAIYADNSTIEYDYILQKIFRDNLERGYLHYNGKINRTRYWSISNNAIRIKDFDWALEFIEKYKDEIRDENETRDIYRLNLANYYFAVGRYTECLDNIPATSPFTEYLLHGKRLELKALFELGSDLFSYKLDAFKMFLSRTSVKLLSENLRQNEFDFANLLQQITSSSPDNPKRSEVLVKRIQEKRQAAEWRWLMEKAKALKKGKK